MKRCYKCKREKPLSEFYRNRTKPDGHQTFCKSCDKSAYGKQFDCTQCGSKFRIEHRNVAARKTRCCQPCAKEIGIQRVVESNKLRTKPEIFSTKGYKYLRDAKEKHGYVLMHRRLMAEHIGRPLRDDEVVHHVDGNRLNNNISNLWLTDVGGHRRAHRTLEIVAFLLLESGEIRFDAIKGEYEITPSANS